MSWSRNRTGLYVQNALAEFQPDLHNPLFSPPAQYKMYKNRLMVTHLIGFGSAPFGGDKTSYSFDGTNDRLIIGDDPSFTFGADNFTIDFFVRFGADTGTQRFIHHTNGGDFITITKANGVNSGDWGIRSDVSGTIMNYTATQNPTEGQWYHLAFVRNGTVVIIFIDGVDQSAVEVVAVSTNNLGDMSSNFVIGANIAGSADAFDGELDEYRVSKGVARWTSGFPVPTSQYNSDANTSLLIHCGEDIVSGTTGSGATFVDSGNIGHTVTETNNTIRNTINFKF